MVILDPETRRDIVGAPKMFLDPSFPMSASFKGTVAPDKVQKVHINDNSAVKLVNDKGRLFRQLGQKGSPMGDYAPMEKFKFVGQFEEKFDLDEGPVDIIGQLGQLSVQDLEELFAYMQRPDPTAVAVRSQIEDPVTGYVRAIPNAAGKSLNMGSRAVNDGILSHNIPLNRIQKGTEVMHGAVKALEDTGADYGTVFIRFNGAGDFEIMDVQTGLHREDCIAIRSYAEMLNKVISKSYVKK